MTKVLSINRRFFLLTVIFLTTSTIITSCGASQNSASGQKEKIKVGVTPVPAG